MKIRTAASIYISILALAGTCIVVMTCIGLANVSQVKSIWSTFEENRSEKSVILNQILANMGYGGMIHNYKNYILRQSLSSKNLTLTYLGAVHTEIEDYRSLKLNSQELLALRHLDETLSDYRMAINKIEKDIQKGKSSETIDAEVNINDAPAIKALKVLKQEARVREEFKQHNKPAILNIIRNVIGFGGMIHHYKNYILRGDPELKKKTLEHFNAAVSELNKYKALHLNAIEKRAINSIQNTLSLYKTKLVTIERLIQSGQKPSVIDMQVQVNDELALFSFQDLNRELYGQNRADEERLNNALISVESSGQYVVFITTFSILLIIIASYVFLRVFIVQRISNLTETMARLANDDTTVKNNEEERNDEIGEMSKTLEVFRRNIDLRRTAEKELLDVNHALENRVEQRTRELKRNEQRLAAVLETAADSIITINNKGIVLSFNSAAIKMFGYSPHEVVGKNISMLMPSPHKEEHDGYLKHYKKTHIPKIIGHGIEAQAVRKGGTIFPIDLAVSEIDNNGETTFTGIIRDISVRQQQEEKIRRSQKMDALGMLTGGIAHDFNNMLNVIRGYADLLEPHLDDSPKLKKYISEINIAGTRATKLTRQLLDFSRHKPNSDQSSTDLNTVILNTQNMIQKSLTARIEINYELETNLWNTFIDATDMENALLNLSINAMHAMPDGGTLTLSTNNASLNEHDAKKYDLPQGNYVVFIISDTGIGMEKEMVSRIFEPFFSTKENSGTGLGLSQVYGFVQRSHGSIHVESSPGSGSEFTIHFPRYNAVDMNAVKPKKQNHEKDCGGNETILVVDDEPGLCLLAKEILLPHGYNVFTAESGNEALRILDNNEVDLIFSDVVMSKMDGFTLASLVKEQFPGMPIQLASGYNDLSHKQDDNELSKDMLAKPYSASELLARIRSLLDKQYNRKKTG